MTLPPFLTVETLEMCANLPLQPNDIFICSYPKSGTTWTQHIVISLLLCHRANIQSKTANSRDVSNQEIKVNANTNKFCGIESSKAIEDITYNHVSQFAPFFDIDAHWDKTTKNVKPEIQHHHDWLGCRVFNTHLQWDMLPKSHPKDSSPASTKNMSKDRKRNPKFFYIVRSPLDVSVSYYNHMSHQVEGIYEGTFDEFFNEWINGEIAFGSWIDHILSFLPSFENSSSHKTQISIKEDILLLSYEEMLSNLPKVLDKIIDFLDLHQSITPKQRNDLLPTFQFHSMKQDLSRFQPISVHWKNNFSFLRKGEKGDSKIWVNEKQRETFLNLIRQKNYMEKIHSCDIDDELKKYFVSLIN